MQAVTNGDNQKVLEMLKQGFIINNYDDSGSFPLYAAVSSDNLDMVRLLLWKDADVQQRHKTTGWTVLHEATKQASLEICDILLHRGANPNVTSPDGVQTSKMSHFFLKHAHERVLCFV